MVSIKRFGIVIPRKTSNALYIALYELPLYKRMWRNRTGNPSFEVEVLPMDQTPKDFRVYENVTLEGEMARLKKMFTTNSERLGDVFAQVYPRDEDFAEDFYAALEDHGVGMDGDVRAAVEEQYREPRETEQVEGVTRVIADKLAAAGVTTLLDLATIEQTKLVTIADVKPGKAKQIREAARVIAEQSTVLAE
jgi:predicted flap endonuclease-1-like 5' DNA nuclease